MRGFARADANAGLHHENAGRLTADCLTIHCRPPSNAPTHSKCNLSLRGNAVDAALLKSAYFRTLSRSPISPHRSPTPPALYSTHPRPLLPLLINPPPHSY